MNMTQMIKMTRGATKRAALVLAILAGLPTAAFADITWNLSVDGNWDTNSFNWTGDSTTFTDNSMVNVIFDKAVGGTISISPNMSPLSTTVNSSGNYTFNGGPIDNGTLTKSGTGTLTLSGANTYTGKTTVNAGTVIVNSLANVGGGASALGAPTTVANGTIDLYNGATLQYTGGVSTPTTDRVINLAGSGGTVTLKYATPDGGTWTLNGNVTSTASGPTTLSTSFNNNGTVVFNGTISDSAGGATSLTAGVAGGGTTALTLGNANNSYSGKTTISRGTLTFSSIKNVGGGNSSLGSIAAGDTANGTIDVCIGNKVSLIYNGSGDITDRVLNLAGANNLTLNNSGSGLLKFTSDWTATGTGNKTILLQTGKFELGGAIPDSASGGINSLTVQFVSSCTLSAMNSSYSGATLVAGGGAVTIKSINKIGSNSSLGTGANVAGGTITIGSGANGGILVYNGTGSGIGNEGTTDRMIKLDGNGACVIDQSGAGLLKFTGGVTATAGTRPLTLQGSTAGSGEISGVISNGAATAINITKAGTNTWTLSGTNTYSGTTKVSAGTLRAGIASVAGYGAFGTTSAVTLDNVAGVVLDLNGYNTAIGSLAGGGTSGGNVTLGTNTLTIGSNNTSPAAFAGIISGTGGNLVKVGTGTNTLSGVNTYTGTTTVNVGTLQTAVSNCLNTASSVVIADGAKMYLNFTGTNTITSLKLGSSKMNKGVYNASNQSTFLTGSGALKVTTSPANGTLISFF